jgi:DNA (cytosine-5)-methyltransferase 1
MKILNLYAGIGGNRKLWGDEHEITAVEYNKEVADVYKIFFPNDNVIVADAHEYLLEHVSEYDFIWSSPPCPTHSRMRILMAEQEGKKFKFPDMKLWEEIIFLQHFSKGKYVVENVVTYYKPFVIPKKLGNHYYWSNFNLGDIKETARNLIRMKQDDKIKEKSLKFGYNFEGLNLKKSQILKMLDNCVEPKTGLHILDCAMNILRNENTEQTKLF